MLPTYIIIGGMKCGTSSLHEYLSTHPEIGTSTSKELDFFLTPQDFAKGVGWYAAQFLSSSGVRGEASPNYTKFPLFPGVPKRMHSVVPDCQLIYLVREPISRALSDYVHSRSAGWETRPIDKALHDFEHSRLVYTGRYLFQLQQYLEYYHKDQILVVFSEDLRNNRLTAMARVFRFLGVDDTFIDQTFEVVHNQASVHREHSAPYRFAENHLPAVLNFARKVAGSRLRPHLNRFDTHPIKTPRLDPRLRAELAAFYEPHNRALAAFLETSLPANWLRAGTR